MELLFLEMEKLEEDQVLGGRSGVQFQINCVCLLGNQVEMLSR